MFIYVYLLIFSHSLRESDENADWKKKDCLLFTTGTF